MHHHQSPVHDPGPEPARTRPLGLLAAAVVVAAVLWASASPPATSTVAPAAPTATAHSRPVQP